MPRQPRLEIPGIPVHVTQRGVNRCAVYLDDDDRQHYLKLLAAIEQRHALQIHSYVFMGNLAHLLIGSEKAGALSKANAKSRKIMYRHSTAGIGVPAHRGRGASSRAWSIRIAICLRCTAISSSIQCAPPWSKHLSTTRGQGFHVSKYTLYKDQ